MLQNYILYKSNNCYYCYKSVYLGFLLVVFNIRSLIKSLNIRKF